MFDSFSDCSYTDRADALRLVSSNRERLRRLEGEFDPVSGIGSVGERFPFKVDGFPIPLQMLPSSMEREPMVVELVDAGSIAQYCRIKGIPPQEEASLCDLFLRLRCRHDFPFWAATLAKIRNKGGGPDRFFSLNPPQRRLVEQLENMRLNNRPIRLILLKARQWGGSTCIQLYMAWMQLTAHTGLNSLIIAHQSSASREIRDMFIKMMEQYPTELLHPPGTEISPKERKMVADGNGGLAFRIPARNAKIKLGTAERPDGCRGVDCSLLHLSEVGLWKRGTTKKPEDTIRAATSGIIFRPGTMIALESTANGTGNYFHREYEAAKRGESQFEALFIGWYQIPQYSIPLSEEEELRMAEELLANREADSTSRPRGEPGRYLWYLWERGATLQGIAWYIEERKKYSDHSQMASEYPTDDIEAFSHSGQRVFDIYRVESLRQSCLPPAAVGEVCGEDPAGPGALRNLRFREDRNGCLSIWRHPDRNPSERYSDRYLVTVDIGGRGPRADWSVIAVFDRLPLLSGNGPEVVAQWRGHTDLDKLAWYAASLAKYYDEALLVIESNTAETRSTGLNDTGGAPYILAEIKHFYDNLYARAELPDAFGYSRPARYGFHTNVATKPLVINHLIKVVREKGYTERENLAVDELLTYERKANGAFGAIDGCHDDILMTRAIGLYISYNEMETPRRIPSRNDYSRRRARNTPDLRF